ncbi:hypothetical protein RvY_08667 [Ramazzottius varieornatus]|uniref:Uncharacterized protein n=1 Tax=Ramazzottius varieornatus TaxID=947166 RepID=A0A1D1V8X3_RAMVA|nr:hypothetical protein RvY_08667 [Ramazzottius varieornatus]
MTISYANASSGNNDSFLMKDNVSFDTAQWLRDHLGYETSENAVTYTIVYGLLFVLGIFGNVSTVIVIVLARRRSGWTGIDAYLLK